jgi:hypothetical protein
VAGVELYNNTALQHKANDETDDVTTCRIFEKTVRKRGVWRKNCGWSDLNNNTELQHKANDETDDVNNLSNFRKICSKMRSTAKLWLE